jgi:hypothetical protein
MAPLPFLYPWAFQIYSLSNTGQDFVNTGQDFVNTLYISTNQNLSVYDDKTLVRLVVVRSCVKLHLDRRTQCPAAHNFKEYKVIRREEKFGRTSKLTLYEQKYELRKEQTARLASPYQNGRG